MAKRTIVIVYCHSKMSQNEAYHLHPVAINCVYVEKYIFDCDGCYAFVTLL